MSNNDIEAQARDWSVALSSGDADKTMLEQFARWRSADPKHEAAFQEVDRVWRGLSQLQHLHGYARLPAKEPSFLEKYIQSLKAFSESLTRPQGAFAGAAAFILVLALSLGILINFDFGGQAPMIVAYQSAKAEIKTAPLDDGSTITLAPLTRLRVIYSDKLRKVELRQGEALFAVSSNPQRPFVVLTGNTETRVLGTEFAVKRYDDTVQVAVKEGRVEVGAADDDERKPDRKVLIAGQGVAANLSGTVSTIKPVDPSTVGAWKDGRLIYENATLEEIIRDANHYSDVLILLGSRELRSKQISIAFKTDNIDQMLDNIADVLQLEIDRELPGTTVIKENNK